MGFCAKTIDEACDLMAWLYRDTHEFETSCSDYYVLPPSISTYAPTVCEIYHCSNHDSTYCPYYIFDDGFARLSSMIETMNKQQVEFANKIREYDLSNEIDHRFSSPRLNVYLSDDGASYPHVESRRGRI